VLQGVAGRSVAVAYCTPGRRPAVGRVRQGRLVRPRPRRRGDPVKLTGVELRRIRMPLVAPFRTSFGTETTRDILLLRVVTGEAEGWGECVAMSDPLYSSEYVDAASDVLTRFLIPALAAHGRLDAYAVGRVLAPFKGHRMAKPGLEPALLDAELPPPYPPLP